VAAVDRFTWGVAAGAVILVVAAVTAVSLVQARQPAPDLSRPEGVVRAYLDALQAKRPEAAWDLLSSAAQGGTTREAFIQRAIGYRPSPQERVTIDRVDVQGDTAYVTLSRTTAVTGLFGPGSYSSEVTVRLVREGGQWRIDVPPDGYLIGPPVAPPAKSPSVSPPAPATASPSP
jgi:hypothetical protein